MIRTSKFTDPLLTQTFDAMLNAQKETLCTFLQRAALLICNQIELEPVRRWREIGGPMTNHHSPTANSFCPLASLRQSVCLLFVCLFDRLARIETRAATTLIISALQSGAAQYPVVGLHMATFRFLIRLLSSSRPASVERRPKATTFGRWRSPRRLALAFGQVALERRSYRSP